MQNYKRYRTTPLNASTGAEMQDTNLPAGITETTARTILADLMRHATINGRLTYRLQVRDIRDPYTAWRTMGASDPMALPEADQRPDRFVPSVVFWGSDVATW